MVIGGALMVAINGMSEGSAAFTNKQLVSLGGFAPIALIVPISLVLSASI